MILVVGATGILGGMIARGLLAQGKEVRILVRHDSPSEGLAEMGMATSAKALIDVGAQPVYGDLKDRASLEGAVKGVDTVITTANSALRSGEDNPQTVELEGNHNLIDAAREAGVEHFVFTSALIAEADSPVPFLLGKGKSEEHLRESGMTYTILAPNTFMEIWVPTVVGRPVTAGEPVTLVGEGRRKHSFVSMKDVAAFALAAVDNAAARDQRIAIGGPEPVSWRDVIATFERVLGQEIVVRSVSPGEPVPGVPEAMQPLMVAFEMYDSPVDMTETARRYGVELTSLEQYVREQFGSAA
jgi:uncharacterized protein YbjT (DUF2867 family)